MFGSCLSDRFACAAWSDPGIVFDEKRPNVNYWDPWYLGAEEGSKRPVGLPDETHPRTGAYQKLIEHKMDLHELHALMAPRPFLVSGGSEDQPARWIALNHSIAVNRLLGFNDRVGMTNRPAHDPTVESNEIIYRFFEHVLGNAEGGTRKRGKIIPTRNAERGRRNAEIRSFFRVPPSEFPHWSDGAPADLRERLDLFHQLGESGEIHLLLAVAQSFGGIRMDLDEKSINAHRDRAPTKRAHEIGAAAALARINNHWQMRFLFDDRHGGKIERVARIIFEGPDAAFTKHYVRIPVSEQVFGGEQPIRQSAHSNRA
jgi:hypothetical protein